MISIPVLTDISFRLINCPCAVAVARLVTHSLLYSLSTLCFYLKNVEGVRVELPVEGGILSVLFHYMDKRMSLETEFSTV
jgi:hypothetical protein